MTRPPVRKKPPARPGWYWTRRGGRGTWAIVWVWEDNGAFRIYGPGYICWPVASCGKEQQWAGPVQPPARRAKL